MNKGGSKKKLVVISLFVVFLITAVAYIYYDKASYQLLTVNVAGNPSGASVEVYHLGTKGDKAPVDGVVVSQPIRLKRGDYEVNFSGDDFRQETQPVTLGKSEQTITITPQYSEQKLGRLFTKEASAIHGEIARQIPGIGTSYIVDAGKLYLMGQWYGTRIHIKQNSEEEQMSYVDIFRIIMKKEAGGWVLITKPPELILSKIKYPDIPVDVLNDVNLGPY